MSLLVLALLPLLPLHLSGPQVSFGSCPGALSTSGTASNDPLHYPNVDDGSDKEDGESPSLGKGDFSKTFQEMISLLPGYFPQSNPSVAWNSDDLIPWLDVLGNTRRRSPRVFLNPRSCPLY